MPLEGQENPASGPEEPNNLWQAFTTFDGPSTALATGLEEARFLDLPRKCALFFHILSPESHFPAVGASAPENQDDSQPCWLLGLLPGISGLCQPLGMSCPELGPCSLSQELQVTGGRMKAQSENLPPSPPLPHSQTAPI